MIFDIPPVSHPVSFSRVGPRLKLWQSNPHSRLEFGQLIFTLGCPKLGREIYSETPSFASIVMLMELNLSGIGQEGNVRLGVCLALIAVNYVFNCLFVQRITIIYSSNSITNLLVSCLSPFFAMVHLETNTLSSMPSSDSQHGISQDRGCSQAQEQLAVAKTIMLQAVELVDNHLTSDGQLTVNSKYLPGSTIGTRTHVYNRNNTTQTIWPYIREAFATCSRPFRPSSRLHRWSLPSCPLV